MGALEQLMKLTQPRAEIGGLNNMIGNLARDAESDYQTTRTGSEPRKAQVQQASDDLAGTYMQGYDPNAYDAQAWAQAGIGAATPTLSALESLNRAVGGYSGVKLQQRADFAKRLEQEKQVKLQQQQLIQQQESNKQQNAAATLMELYKTGQLNKNQLLQALSDRYVNVTGRGLVDKFALASGDGNPIAVPSLKPAEMFQSLQQAVASEMEQDKNLHFKTAEERAAAINSETTKRWRQLSGASGGVLPTNPFMQGVDSSQPVPGFQEPLPTEMPAREGVVPLKGGYIDMSQITPDANPPVPSLNKPIEQKHMELLPGERANIDDPENPNMQIKPIEGFGVKTAGDPSKATSVPTGGIPSAPWAKYLSEPVPSAQSSGKIFNKVEQERQIAQNAAAEKIAEETYGKIAEQADSTVGWYDTLRELNQTDLSATGSFANVRNSAGKLLATLGYEQADLAKDATNLSKINNLLMQGIQARLSLQNGVQARDDATRETQSFAQITDPKIVFRGLIKQAEAKSLRLVEKEEFWRNWKEQKGSYNGASTAWNKYVKETPLFAMYGGKPTYYNQFTEQFLRLNQDTFAKRGMSEAEAMQIATEKWREIAKGSKK